jgi:hypothetical protein
MIFTFEGIRDELEARLSLLSDWASTLYYGTYRRITDMTAYVMDKVVYLTEFFYNEANWTTATLISSLMPKCRLLSYNPHRKQGATGNVVISKDPAFSALYTFTGYSTIIPRWTQFSNANNDVFVYSTADAVYYKNTVGNKTVAVKEGEVKTYTYTAVGDNSEVITVYSDKIDNDEIQVDIVNTDDEVLYSVRICGTSDYADELFLIEDLDNYYCKIENAYDFKSITLTFGDGVRNKKLNVNDRVKITYAETKGTEGNIESTSVIIVIVDTLTDGNGDDITLYVKNTDEISEATDIETLEEIRYNAPNIFTSGYRCGNLTDWETLLESSQYIHKVRVWSNEDLETSVSTDNNKIFVTAISADGEALTSTQQDAVVLEMKEYKSPTDIIEWKSLEIVWLLFKIDATITNQPFGVVSGQIADMLDDNYGILNVNFQENVYQSNYIAKIDELENVLHHETFCYHMEKDFSTITVNHEASVSWTSGDTSTLADQVYVTYDTVELWLEQKVSGVWASPKRIAYETGGVLTGEGGFTITDSNINHSTNTIGFTVQTMTLNPVTYGVRDPGDDDLLGYLLHVAYKTQDGNGEQLQDIRLPQPGLITDVDSRFIIIDMQYE